MSGRSLRIGMDVELEPATAFDLFVEELATALAGRGIGFDPGPESRITEGEVEVGRVVDWEPGVRLALEWRSAAWQPEEPVRVELTFEAADGGTRVSLEHRDMERPIAEAGELVGWLAGQVVAPVWQELAPARLGDWLTDRGARRPSGARARSIYGDPIYHYPMFEVLLAELAPGPEDVLLEVGCGGGVLLKRALERGCSALAVDHSAEMVRLACESNREAVEAGRLDIREASAENLPFADGSCTCATMSGVLGFLPDPVAALREIRRVLAAGGRLMVLGTDPEVKGTPAAPEPMASRLRFYDTGALEELGRAAGFESVEVVRRPLEDLARQAGVPEEHLPLFGGPGPRFLLARKG